ncbi:rho guanine nucleotide exchange factor 28-like [Trichomycterus rosablanca]|uniref:rho guanine nucleotide exchange factor 28-like n=1 Tax=Trichomycterus rosablanca TaxID=2290929 RepID=UPI002F3557CC
MKGLGCEELFVLLEGSSVLHVLQTKLHTLTYFITPGHNQQETVCVRAYTYDRGVLQYVGVSFLTYVEDDGQHMAEYLPGALMLINSANQEGDTPLQLAQRTNQHTLVHLLTHPPNPLVSPLGGVVCVQIDSAHLLRFMHPARVMSLSVCVSECVSDNDFESRCSPVSAVTRTESISSCSDAEDEEPLLSISSDVSENEPNVTSSSTIITATTTAEVHQSEEEPEKTQLSAGSDSDESRNQSEEGNKLTPSTRPGVTQKVPLKSDTVSMLLSSSHSSPALLVSSHMTNSHRRRSNSEGCGHEMTMRKSWSVIGQPPCELPAPVTLDYTAESWSAAVEPEFLRDLDRGTVKRQEVIYELMQTEFHHVQTLAVMIGVLRRGLQEEVQLEQDVIAQIFPGLDELMDVHRNFLTTMESRRPAHARNHVLHRVGDVLLQQFSGSCARHMVELYGEFCSKQPEALRLYKQLQQNNRKLQVFLRQQSCKSVIKRREIPEFLLLVTQRITKYPVLLERLLQHTGGGGVERDDVTAALEGVRGVISGVESHVEKIQLARQLDDILNRLDNKSFTRLKSGEVYSKHTLLHTTHTHTLTHCSGVTCRSTSGRLRAPLLEQKPAVVPLRGLILREIANQDRGLFLISSDAAEPEMYEIHTSTREERERWISLLQRRSFPENELKNTEELKSSRMQTVHGK